MSVALGNAAVNESFINKKGSKMKKKLYIIIIVVIAAAAGAVGYYFYNQSTQSSVQKGVDKGITETEHPNWWSCKMTR